MGKATTGVMLQCDTQSQLTKNVAAVNYKVSIQTQMLHTLFSQKVIELKANESTLSQT
ncbi:MAG: hypothetical protein ACJA0G_001157 [Kangiellaceae bacterium]|jgi:hypothetical protein